MTMVKTLVALATERMLLKTSGPTFLRGIEFMYAAGLAPDRLSVMMTSSHKYVLQFHSKCDIRPFAANYPNFGRVLRGIVHVREWRIKSIEFVNVAFYMRDVDNLERAIEKLGVELVLLRNCTYPGVQRGDEAVKFLSALNRKKQAVVCEYGDDRLKHRIGRRASRARRASRNGQEVVLPQDPAEVIAAPAPAAAAAAAAPAPAQVQAAPRIPEAIPEAPAALNNDPAPMAPRPHAHRERHQVRRPVPMNPEQARHAMQQIIIPPLPGIPPADAAQNPPQQQQAAAAPNNNANNANLMNAPLPGRSSNGRVVVGAHVYEFRAVDVPNADNIPAVQNLNHLLNVLSENAQHDLRVIVLPPDARAGQALQLNPQNNLLFRAIHHPANVGAVAAQAVQAAQAAIAAGGAASAEAAGNAANGAGGGQPRVMNYGQPQQPQQQQNVPGRQPAYGVFNAAYNPQQPPPPPPGIIPRALVVPVQVPMFDADGNDVQRIGGEESNDSTDREDREEMYEPARNDAERDLAADAEAQPNFAPVEMRPVEFEEDDDDDDAMEEMNGDGQFMQVDQPEPVEQ